MVTNKLGLERKDWSLWEPLGGGIRAGGHKWIDLWFHDPERAARWDLPFTGVVHGVRTLYNSPT
jgi:hypothetical protein